MKRHATKTTKTVFNDNTAWTSRKGTPRFVAKKRKTHLTEKLPTSSKSRNSRLDNTISFLPTLGCERMIRLLHCWLSSQLQISVAQWEFRLLTILLWQDRRKNANALTQVISIILSGLTDHGPLVITPRSWTWPEMDPQDRKVRLFYLIIEIDTIRDTKNAWKNVRSKPVKTNLIQRTDRMLWKRHICRRSQTAWRHMLGEEFYLNVHQSYYNNS